MRAVLNDRVQIARNVNGAVISLDAAPDGYAGFRNARPRPARHARVRLSAAPEHRPPIRRPRENLTTTLAWNRFGRGSVVTSSFAEPDRTLLPTRWRVELHPTMLRELVILHELAHCVARSRVGPMFTATLAALVEQFGTGTHRADLADAYAHFEVAVALREQRHRPLEITPPTLRSRDRAATPNDRWCAISSGSRTG